MTPEDQLAPKAALSIPVPPAPRRRAATETPLQSSFKKLPLVDALKVYGAMNQNERNQVGDILEAKRGRAKQ